MHGNYSDGRLCFLEVCAARDSPVANGVRQRPLSVQVARNVPILVPALEATHCNLSCTGFFQTCLVTGKMARSALWESHCCVTVTDLIAPHLF